MDYLKRLLILSGQEPDDVTTDISGAIAPEIDVTSSCDDQETDIDLNDILRMLNLAGLDVTIDAIPDISVDEQADYDVSKNEVNPNGEDVDINVYKIRGEDNLPTRYVPAKSGDNPLTGDKGIEPVKEMSSKSLRDYLNELGK